MSDGLIVFTKNPRLGQVKSRLAKTLGADKALDIYNRLVSYTQEVLDHLSVNTYIYYSSTIDEDDHWDKRFVKRIQMGESLGDRMSHAFSQVLQEHNKAVIIGTDCGVITPVIINEAFRILKRTDVVIGPSEDGGYYLLGMNNKNPSIFVDIEWSSDRVYRQTMQKINALRLSCTSTVPLYDIDHEEDWNRLNWK